MTDLEGALSELKRQGSASLIVGSVPHDAYVRVSRRMLGTNDQPRRRVLVIPETDCEAAIERLKDTGPLDPAHAQVVACNGTSRSAAATAAAAPEGGATIHRVEDSFADIGAAITTAVDRLDAAAGGLSAAELRIGVDPVSVFGGYDTSATFGFFHAFTRQVRRVDGMAHVRVPRDRDDEAVRTLSPLFDAVLELRLDGYQLEQRWHVREHDIVSDWLTLPDLSDGG